MKLLIMFITLVVLSSCSTAQEKRNLSQRVQMEQVRSLQEIKSHAAFLLDSHPELDVITKKELGALLDATITKQQALKDEESKIFQLLLSKSLMVNQLTDSEVRDKNNLKIRLVKVNEEKSNNVLALIDKIVRLSENNAINDSFRNDIMYFIRETR